MDGCPAVPSSVNSNVEFRANQIDRFHVLRSSHGGLCFRCRSGMVTRRARDFDPRILCLSINQKMPPDIAECTRFQSSGELTIWELVQIAEVIDVKSSKRVGFEGFKEERC